jgi:uncharacterized membrane protein YjjP (DUF1212 family)
MLGASWKTTAAGITAILLAVGNAFTQYLQGGLATINWEVLLAGVVAGIGLIMAKDAGVTNSPAPVAARALPVKLPTP